MNHIVIYILLILMTLIGAMASLFLKRASSFDSIITLLKNKWLYIGGLLYLLSALLNILILKYLDYSVVLPLTSITYIWTMILSKTILKEQITSNKIFGTLLIFLGAIIIIL